MIVENTLVLHKIHQTVVQRLHGHPDSYLNAAEVKAARSSWAPSPSPPDDRTAQARRTPGWCDHFPRLPATCPGRRLQGQPWIAPVKRLQAITATIVHTPCSDTPEGVSFYLFVLSLILFSSPWERWGVWPVMGGKARGSTPRIASGSVGYYIYIE